MTRLLSPAALLVVLATGCAKNDAEPTIDFGPNNGYTMRTATNQPGAQADPTDWTHDAAWTSTEQNLFASLGLALGGVPTQVSSWYTSAYPNPSLVSGGGDFIILSTAGLQSTTVPATVRVKLVVVDAHYQVLYTTDALVGTANTLPLSFPAATYTVGSLYRLYYVVYEPTQKTVYYRGHGDVLLK